MPKSILLIVGVLVAGLVIGGVFSATGEAVRKIGDPGGGTGTTTTIFPNIKVTTDLDIDVEPAIFNNKVIWTNECCTIFTTQDRGIPLSNIDFCDISLNGKIGGCLAGDTKLRIERARYIFTSVYQNFQPDVYENRIVWTQRKGNDLNIMMCDLSKNGQVGGCLTNDAKDQITSSFPNVTQVDPAIYNNIIVWRDITNSNWDIYRCDLTKNGQVGGCLTNNPKTRVTNSTSAQINPDIYENTIIWVDNNFNGKVAIFMCDLTKNGQPGGCLVGDSKTLVHSSNYFFDHPKIQGNLIVWSDSVRTLPGTSEIDNDIFMCDLTKNGQPGGCLVGDSKTQVTSTGQQDIPDVYGNVIVWSSWPDYQYNHNSPNNIFMCNILLNGNKGGCLANDEKIQLSYTTNSNWKTAKIYGNNIIWTDERNGNVDLYMTQI